MDFKNTQRFSAYMLATGLVAMGCSDDSSEGPERIELSVMMPGPVFSWEGEPVGELYVISCENTDIGDVCDFGNSCSDAEIVFSLSATTNSIPSPVEYGIEGGQPDPFAKPLLDGMKYSVEVERSGPCDDGEEGCSKIIAHGCAIFTP